MSAELPRRTKIVATLGPASSSHEIVLELARAGMDAARLNFSHGTHEDHAQRMQVVREVSEEVERPIAIIADLQGPKVRIGDLDEPVTLDRGDQVVVAAEDAAQDGELPVEPDGCRRGAPAGSRRPDRRRAHPSAGRVGRARPCPVHGRRRRRRRGPQGRERPGRPGPDPVAHAQGHGRPRLRARPGRRLRRALVRPLGRGRPRSQGPDRGHAARTPT